MSPIAKQHGTQISQQDLSYSWLKLFIHFSERTSQYLGGKKNTQYMKSRIWEQSACDDCLLELALATGFAWQIP